MYIATTFVVFMPMLTFAASVWQVPKFSKMYKVPDLLENPSNLLRMIHKYTVLKDLVILIRPC